MVAAARPDGSGTGTGVGSFPRRSHTERHGNAWVAVVTTWFTSDLHVGHANIIKYCGRPFADVDHMDAELARRWRERVMPDDVVWVLGDVAMGTIADSLALVASLPGEKHLVAGNHDRCWEGNRKHERWVERYHDAGFVDIVTRVEIDLGGGVVLPACHFPYRGDSLDEER